MKKGFTLIEMLAVLVILALLMMLAFPNFADLSSKAVQNYDRSTIVLIRSAARMYVTNNLVEVNNEIELSNNKQICVPVGKLIAYEYLDSEIKDSKGTTINDDVCVIVAKSEENKKYTYSVSNDKKASDFGITDFYPPVVTINSLTEYKCKNYMEISIDDYNNKCQIKATDNVDAQAIFMGLKQEILQKDENGNVVSEDNEKIRNKNRALQLEKVIAQEGSKIFIEYTATDSSGNVSTPLKVQLKTE